MYSNYKATAPQPCIFKPTSEEYKYVTFPILKTKYSYKKHHEGETIPKQVSVCTNSSGFTIKDEFVVKSQDGEPFPSPALFVHVNVKTWENFLLVTDIDCNIKGKVNIQVNNKNELQNYPHKKPAYDNYCNDDDLEIVNIYLDDDKQRILICDCKFSLLVVKELDGTDHKIMSLERYTPRNVAFDSSRVFISCGPNDLAGLKDNVIFVLDRDSYSQLAVIKHESLVKPGDICLTSTSLFVSDLQEDGQLLQFNLDGFAFVGPVTKDPIKALGMTTIYDNSLLVIDNYSTIHQLSTNGEIETNLDKLGVIGEKICLVTTKSCSRIIVSGWLLSRTYQKHSISAIAIIDI